MPLKAQEATAPPLDAPAAVDASAVMPQSFEIPTDTIIHVRLRQDLSSYGSKANQGVVADVIAPVEVGGRMLLPIGARFYGYVNETRKVGVGLSREVAFIDLVFDLLGMPGGSRTQVSAVVAGVDNSRETIDENGRINGIRATGTVSSTFAGMALSIGFVDPILLGFTASTSLSAFRIPESEVILPPGTEMTLRLTAPFVTSQQWGYPVPLRIAQSTSEEAALESLVRSLPFRTATPNDGTPSDLTNLLFLGSEESLMKAFSAAGWSRTDQISGESVYGVMRSVVEDQGYQEAPMSTLLLDGSPPVLTYAKTLDTFFSRHHLRIFATPDTFEDATVWTSSSTQDIGVGFATNTKTFIHLIDENIDHERNKVVNDLVITGCVDAVQYVNRPWVPRDAQNATGDSLITDGRIAVIELNECVDPQLADKPLPETADIREKPGGVNRFFRDFVLMMKNSGFRGNIIYQGYWGAKLGFGALFGGGDEGDEARVIEFGGQQWEIVPGPEAHNYEDHITDPVHTRPRFQPLYLQQQPSYVTRLEFSASGGYMRFGNDRFSTQQVFLDLPVEGVGEFLIPVDMVTKLTTGWNLAFKTTLNSHRYFSHEFGYTFNSSGLEVTVEAPIVPDEVITGPANIRQFSYNLLVHARPNGKRIRPYAAVGPVLQMIRVSEPLESSRGLFRFGFKEVGIIVGAWNFGSTPPLEGGGIFQPALQYGAGVKFYLAPNWLLRLDFRETLSAQPDVWTKSYDTLSGLDIENGTVVVGELTKYGLLRHQAFTFGLGFAF